jgi:hypothetical protein
MSSYTVRDATVNEQRELTQLCVRATMCSGYDEAFIDRVMPGLTITVPLIAGGCVQVVRTWTGRSRWRRDRDHNLASGNCAALRHLC